MAPAPWRSSRATLRHRRTTLSGAANHGLPLAPRLRHNAAHGQARNSNGRGVADQQAKRSRDAQTDARGAQDAGPGQGAGRRGAASSSGEPAGSGNGSASDAGSQHPPQQDAPAIALMDAPVPPPPPVTEPDAVLPEITGPRAGRAGVGLDVAEVLRRGGPRRADDPGPPAREPAPAGTPRRPSRRRGAGSVAAPSAPSPAPVEPAPQPQPQLADPAAAPPASPPPSPEPAASRRCCSRWRGRSAGSSAASTRC
jgi:hypothetical protein